jgi:hypothetical protein
MLGEGNGGESKVLACTWMPPLLPLRLFVYAIDASAHFTIKRILLYSRGTLNLRMYSVLTGVSVFVMVGPVISMFIPGTRFVLTKVCYSLDVIVWI